MDLQPLILQAQAGNLAAYAQLVAATQNMVHAVCYRILQNPADALDAAQDTYLRAFQRLADLRDPAAFPGWLRRIAVTAAHDLSRHHRLSFLDLADLPDVPILDELEQSWSDAQRRALAAALLALSPADRRLCDRFYHGNWPIARLAADAAIAEPAMKKRLQRIRDTLRKETEMSELQNAPHHPSANLPAKVVELLAHPRLIDLPENPVGKITDLLRACFPDYTSIDTPEIIDTATARTTLDEPRIDITRIDPAQRVDATRALRYDLSVPLLLTAIPLQTPTPRLPLRLLTAGKVYRAGRPDPTHLEAFHQLEILRLETALSPWSALGDLLRVLHALLPNATIHIASVNYPLCSQSWELTAELSGRRAGIAGCGLYTPHITRALAADPATTAAFGIGFGLERLAALKYNYDDLRKLASAQV